MEEDTDQNRQGEAPAGDTGEWAGAPRIKLEGRSPGKYPDVSGNNLVLWSIVPKAGPPHYELRRRARMGAAAVVQQEEGTAEGWQRIWTAFANAEPNIASTYVERGKRRAGTPTPRQLTEQALARLPWDRVNISIDGYLLGGFGTDQLWAQEYTAMRFTNDALFLGSPTGDRYLLLPYADITAVRVHSDLHRAVAGFTGTGQDQQGAEVGMAATHLIAQVPHASHQTYIEILGRGLQLVFLNIQWDAQSLAAALLPVTTQLQPQDGTPAPAASETFDPLMPPPAPGTAFGTLPPPMPGKSLEAPSPPAAPATLKEQPAAGEGDLVQKLSQLAALHRDGSLTDDEFAVAKQALLAQARS